MDTERESTFDWRIRVLTHVVSGNGAPPGSYVYTSIKIPHDKTAVIFPEPSASALFLSQAHRAYKEALESYSLVKRSFEEASLLDAHVLYDYLERMSIAVVFGYSAVEAFTNELIPEDAQHETIRRGVVRLYGKEDIERYLSLDEKLDKVLPTITHKRSPRGSTTWQKYIELRRLRDRLIHLKGKDRGKYTVSQTQLDSVWSRLLAPKALNYPLITKETMLWWYRSDDGLLEPLPHWLKNCPF